MSDWSRPFPTLASTGRAELSWHWYVGLSLAAMGLQTVLPTVQPSLGLLNLPLISTLSLMLWCRTAVVAMLFGAAFGCFYGGLTHWPIGLHGITYTIGGYIVANLGPYLRRDSSLVLSAFYAASYLGYEVMFGIIRDVLVAPGEGEAIVVRLVLAVVHAGVGLFVFTILSKAASTR